MDEIYLIMINDVDDGWVPHHAYADREVAEHMLEHGDGVGDVEDEHKRIEAVGIFKGELD